MTARAHRFRSFLVMVSSGVVLAGLLAGIHGCMPVDRVCEPAPAGAEVSACASVYVGAGSPYERGALTTRRFDIAQCEAGVPRPLLIFAPEQAGSYPVVVFQHGFVSRNTLYTQLLEHVASHGFVVVAPLMYEPGVAVLLGRPTAAEEAVTAAEIIDWLPGHLDELVGVHACTDLLGIGGHSRGGKVAWLVAVGAPTRVKAIVGIEPVDGTGGPLGGQERVINGPFAFSVPGLIIGTGLGTICAPEGENHVQFYEASQSPAWHVVAPGAGHVDIFDEVPEAALARRVCLSGPDPDGMRRLAAGMMVALFRASLQGDVTAYAFLTDVAAAPIPITVESK
jgi:chlorophyllase